MEGPRLEPKVLQPHPWGDPDRPTRFVTFEGIDGSGKSTLVSSVSGALTGRGVDHFTTREETTTWLGAAVRRSIDERADPLATLFLFLADRAHHLERMAPQLRANELILSDRYHDSTLAYQGVTLAERFPRFEAWVGDMVSSWYVTPVRTYLVDVDPEVAVARLAGREKTTNYEKVDFLRRVRERYLALAEAEPERFCVLDGTLRPHQLSKAVVEDLVAQGIAAPTKPTPDAAS